MPELNVVQDHDEEDVKSALARETFDGPGPDDLNNLPEEDA